MPARHNPLYYLIIILAIFGLILPSFCLALPNFAKQNLEGFAQTQAPTIEPPKTLEEAKEIGKRIPGLLPGVFKGIWQEAKSVWSTYVWPEIEWLWQKFWFFLKKEVTKRKPIIKEEFEKEKEEIQEEIKTEVPKIGKSLWERFKELFRE